MSEIFTSSDDLKRAFELDTRKEYVEFTPFTRDVGFSVQRPYPMKSRYSPPVTKDGTPDSYAMIKVMYEPKRISNTSPKLVPISARVCEFPRYIAKHWDYDFNDKHCPTEESIRDSKNTPKPIELSAFDQYYYDHERDVFLDVDGKEMRGIDIIDALYDSHIATVDKLSGMVLRWKIAWRDKKGSLCEVLCAVFKRLLKVACGRTLAPDETQRGIDDDYRPEDVKLLITERIDVFGYKASKNVVVIYSSFLLLGYTILHFSGKKWGWLSGIKENGLLAFAFSILCIVFLDDILPMILLWLINATNRRSWKLLLTGVKFKIAKNRIKRHSGKAADGEDAPHP